MLFAPFLYKGKTLAILSSSGKIPVVNDWLIVIVNIGAITWDILFSNLDEISSVPQLDLGANFFYDIDYRLTVDVFERESSWNSFGQVISIS